MLTGRFHWRKFRGIVNSFGPPSFDAELTLPAMLQQQGYRPACIGKWHLGWSWSAIMRPGAKPDPKTGHAPGDFDWSKPIPGGPRDRGFDYYFGDDVPAPLGKNRHAGDRRVGDGTGGAGRDRVLGRRSLPARRIQGAAGASGCVRGLGESQYRCNARCSCPLLRPDAPRAFPAGAR